MKKNVENYFVAISIIIVLIAGITCIKYRNAIYVWYLGDVQSIYKQAEGYYRQNRMKEAAGLYSKLARIDSASNSQYILGDIYYQGKLGEVNYKKALKLFMKSTEGGNAKAQNNLGFMYTYGIGTEMDYSKAKKILEYGCGTRIFTGSGWFGQPLSSWMGRDEELYGGLQAL